MTDNTPQSTNTSNTHQLIDVLNYVFSKEGLEQNLDIGLNINEEGEIPLNLVLNNMNIKNFNQSQQNIIEALNQNPAVTVVSNNTVVKVDVPIILSIILTDVSKEQFQLLQPHFNSFEESDEIESITHNPEESKAVILMNSEEKAEKFKKWIEQNMPENFTSKVSIHKKSFPSFLKNKYKDQMAKPTPQVMSPGSQNYNVFPNNANYMPMNYQNNQQMMNMMMMMQQQFFMMNMMNMNHTGANYFMPKNNIFVRRAKGSESTHSGRSRNDKHHGGYQKKNYNNNYNNNYYEKKKAQVSEPQVPQTQQTRVRLDSDNFPSLPKFEKSKNQKTENSQKKAIGEKAIVEEEKTQKYVLNNAFIIDFFKSNIDEISKPAQLDKFTLSEIPILEPNGDIRLEQITPTIREKGWFPGYRKGSHNPERKISFKKKRGGNRSRINSHLIK